MTSHKIYTIQQKWVITVNKDEGAKISKKKEKKGLKGIFSFLFLTNELGFIQFPLVSHALNYNREKFYKWP